jgi:hypothetical protein
MNIYAGYRIWAFPKDGHPRAVDVALRSGRITHVAIFAGYRGNPHSDTIDAPDVREAIDIAKEHAASIILFRLLFDPSGAPISNLTDSDYMADQIRSLRAEADRLGILYVGLETEAYGKPLAGYMRGSSFSGPDFDACVQAVRRATDQVGRVDYVTPAGSYEKHHPYLALVELANHSGRISQTTYWDRPKVIEDIEYRYDVAGMFLSVAKRNEVVPSKPYFTARDVFERTEVHGSAGVFIWTEGNDLEVARAMVEERGR